MSQKLSLRTVVCCDRYKVAVVSKEGRHRREDNTVEIRKKSTQVGMLPMRS